MANKRPSKYTWNILKDIGITEKQWDSALKRVHREYEEQRITQMWWKSFIKNLTVIKVKD